MHLHRLIHKHIRRSVPLGLPEDEPYQQPTSLSDQTAPPITYIPTYPTPFSFSVTLPVTDLAINFPTTTITASVCLTTTSVILDQQYATITSFKTVTVPSQPIPTPTTFAHIPIIPPRLDSTEQLAKRTTAPSFEDENTVFHHRTLAFIGFGIAASMLIYLAILMIRALRKRSVPRNRGSDQNYGRMQ